MAAPSDVFRYRLLSKARLISLTPSSRLRIFLLRRLLGYAVDPTATIGFGSLIMVARFTLGANSKIGRNCRFKGPMEVTIGSGVSIGGQNIFHCSNWLGIAKQRGKSGRTLRIGTKTVITSGHYFDCTRILSIGERVIVAGRGSQFWTHGAGAVDGSIEIGDRCYIGSAVRVAPGTKIGNDNIIAMGAVVTGDLSGVTCSMIAGVPGRVIRTVERDPLSGRVRIASRDD